MSNNATFIRRFLARLLDTVITITLTLLPFLLYSLTLSENNVLLSTINWLTFYISFLFLFWVVLLVYNVMFVTKFGGTVGKLLMGLRVVDQTTGSYIRKRTSFLRYTAGNFFSAQFFGIGFLRTLKNPQRLAWHDELFNTKVVENKSAAPGIILLISLLFLNILIVYLSIKVGYPKLLPFIEPLILQ